MYHHFASDLSGHQLTVPFVYNIDQNYKYIYILPHGIGYQISARLKH